MTPEQAREELSFGTSTYKVYDKANQSLNTCGLQPFEMIGGLRGLLDPRCSEWKQTTMEEKIKYLTCLEKSGADLGVLITIFASWYADKPAFQYKLDAIPYGIEEYHQAKYQIPPFIMQILELVQSAFITDHNVISMWQMGLDNLRKVLAKE